MAAELDPEKNSLKITTSPRKLAPITLIFPHVIVGEGYAAGYATVEEAQRALNFRNESRKGFGLEEDGEILTTREALERRSPVTYAKMPYSVDEPDIKRIVPFGKLGKLE